MTARRTDKRRERRCQLYVTAEGADGFMLGPHVRLLSVTLTDDLGV